MTKSKGKKCGPNTQPCQNPINLTFRSKVNVVLGSWMNATHPLMVIHPNIVNQFQSKKKNSFRPDTKTCQNLMNLTLSSKVNIVSGLWMYATYCLMVIPPCDKYGNQCQRGKVTGRTRIITDRRADKLIPIYKVHGVVTTIYLITIKGTTICKNTYIVHTSLVFDI